MKKYKTTLIELQDRIFYMPPFGKEPSSKNPLSEIKGKELTILMNPFSNFENINVDLPKNNYYNSILNYLKKGECPAIILSDYNLDRLIIETLKNGPKYPRIFMQGGTEQHKGIGYYKNSNELVHLVDEINPSKINVGGAFLAETEKELINWDLKKFPWEFSADSGCFVGPIYLLFRDKYPTKLLDNLVLR